MTALHGAAEGGHIEVVVKLVELGASADSASNVKSLFTTLAQFILRISLYCDSIRVCIRTVQTVEKL